MDELELLKYVQHEDPNQDPELKTTRVFSSKTEDNFTIVTPEKVGMEWLIKASNAEIITLSTSNSSEGLVTPSEFKGGKIFEVKAEMPKGSWNISDHPRESNEFYRIFGKLSKRKDSVA